MSIKKLLVFTFFVGILLVPTSANAVFYGGQIVSPPQACDNFSGYTVVIRSVPFGEPINIIFTPGFSRAYLYGPPKNVGQWVLGSGVYDRCDINPAKATTYIRGIRVDRAPGIGTSLI